MKRSLALAIVSAVLMMLPGAASAARPRVALIKFDGDPGGEVQDLVSEALDGDTLVVGPKEVNRTVDKLGLSDDMSEKELKKLATELDADAVVQGKIGKKGDNRIAHFKLFVHGKKKGFSVEFSNLKSEKLKQTVHDKMLEKIGGGSDSRSGDEEADKKSAKKKKHGDDEAEADDKPKKKSAEDDDGAEKKAAKKKKTDDEDDSNTKKKSDDDAATKKKHDDDEEADKPKKKKHGDDDEAAADNDDAPRKSKKRTARRGDDDSSDEELHKSSGDDETPSKAVRSANRLAVRVDLGLSVTTRSLTFTSRTFDQRPNGYTNSPVPGLRVAGEIYPFAFSDPHSPAAGIGIAGDYDKTLSLSLQSTAQPGTKFPVNENHWSIGARYRVPFGIKPTSPTLTLGIGYGTRTFKVDRTALQPGNVIDLPDVAYKGFLPGLEFRIPVAPNVALFFGGNAILVTAAGDIQTNAQYGQAKITGGEGQAGLDVLVGNRIALR
ncbi:MAG: hypothetical protein JWO36_5639, partial [Myxococcales bacterium]|nr:hypothetical protein [Myxococcales bacterium]